MDQNDAKNGDGGRRENPPMGYPYLDTDRTGFSAWENGGFLLKVARKDGELLKTNLTRNELEGFVEMAEYIIESSEEHQNQQRASE